MVEEPFRVHGRIDDLHGRVSRLEARQEEHARQTAEIRVDVKEVLIQVQQIALSMAGKEAAGQHSGKLFGWLMALIVAIGAAATALHQLAVH